MEQANRKPLRQVSARQRRPAALHKFFKSERQKRSAENLRFAAIPVVRGEDGNRTVFSIADLADAGPISSVINHRIYEAANGSALTDL